MENTQEYYLSAFSSRLNFALNTTPRVNIINEADISSGTLFRYLRKEVYPDVNALCDISRLTRFNLHWILFGDNDDVPSHHVITISDNSYTPWITRGETIEYQPVSQQDTPTFADGFYAIKTGREISVASLAWDVNKKQFKTCGLPQDKWIKVSQIIGENLRVIKHLTSNRDNETNHPLSFNYPLSLFMKEQGVEQVQDRLTLLLKQSKIWQLGQKTSISRNTLRNYVSQTSTPDISRLVKIAHALDVPLQEILFADTKPWHYRAKMTTARATVLDNYFPNTLPKGSEFEYSFLGADEPLEQNAIYAIASHCGVIARRITWQENEGRYRVYGDNPIYPNQYIKEVNVIGRVTATLMPL